MEKQKDKQEYLATIGRAQNGCKESFSVIYKHEYSFVYTVLLYKCAGNKELAEDLAADMWIKLLTVLKSWSPKNEFRAWLSTVIHNHYIDYTRTMGKRDSITDSLDARAVASEDPQVVDTVCLSAKLHRPMDAPSPEDLMILNEKSEYIRIKISELSDSHRVLVEKKYFDELSYREISGQLDIPEETVKSRLNKARTKLRSIMTDSLILSKGEVE